MAVQVVEVLGEAAQPQTAQAPRKAAVDQLVLAFREADAGALVEPLTRLLEVPPGVEELMAGDWQWGAHGGGLLME
ncbi:hypothetical protein D3C76_1824100 [compost metagenome]